MMMRTGNFLGAVIASVFLLTACGGNEARFLIQPASPERTYDLRFGRIELRDVSLPAYASSPEIAMQEPSGALRNIDDTLWADDPVRGVTSALARALDDASDAVVVPEPWPLNEPADLRIDVRVDRMLARADGQFELSGSYAYFAPDGFGRGTIERFSILVPVPAEGAGGIAASAGNAIGALAGEILGRLSR